MASPEALADAAVHRSRSRPEATPRSLCRKMERKGNAKLNPKIAMNSANHRAARLRLQLTPPALIGGTVARGSADSFLGLQDFHDPVGGYRNAVDDSVWLQLAQRIFDRGGDRGRDRDRPALPGALETLRVGVGRSADVHDQGLGGNLAGADDRVVEESRGSEAPVAVVDGRLVKGVADPVREAPVHLALDDQLVDLLANVMGDDVAEDLDLPCLRFDSDHRCVA